MEQRTEQGGDWKPGQLIQRCWELGRGKLSQSIATLLPRSPQLTLSGCALDAHYQHTCKGHGRQGHSELPGTHQGVYWHLTWEKGKQEGERWHFLLHIPPPPCHSNPRAAGAASSWSLIPHPLPSKMGEGTGESNPRSQPRPGKCLAAVTESCSQRAPSTKAVAPARGLALKEAMDLCGEGATSEHEEGGTGASPLLLTYRERGHREPAEEAGPIPRHQEPL